MTIALTDIPESEFKAVQADAPVVFADLFTEVVDKNNDRSDSTDTSQSWTSDNDA